MSTATATTAKPKTMPPPPRPKEKPGAKFGRIGPLERTWKERYRRYQGGESVEMPTASVLTSDEASFYLRIDILSRGDRRSGLVSLRRLVDLGRLVAISYSGRGGGEAMYRRQDLESFLAKTAGEA